MTNANRRRCETAPTVILPSETMRQLVYGRPPSRARLPGAITLVLGLLAGAAGCHATAPAPEPETVGQLAPSYNSVATAPVHASTDFAAPVVVETDDGDEARGGAPEAVEAPAVVAKGGGLVTGEVR